MGRLIILPALPASSIQNEFRAIIKPIDFNYLKNFVETHRNEIIDVINYNRHQATNKILEKYIGLPMKYGEMYQMNPKNDVIVLVGLKTRAPKGTADLNISESDLALAMIEPQ